jgi:predicted N-formylglutamate amidohydrolase
MRMMAPLPDQQPIALLAADEPPAFEVVNRQGGGMALLVCDHAANRVPRQLGALGLDAAQLADHIAWDPGAAEVARHLSVHLDAPLVLSGYSRLVIDCNRPLGHAQSIAEQSAGIPIPGNIGITAAEREMRGAALFQPYHDAIAGLLDERRRQPTLLLSIHSFTPVLHGQQRPWQVGISHWRDRRLADGLIQALTRDPELTVGDNAPYPIDESPPKSRFSGESSPVACLNIGNGNVRRACEGGVTRLGPGKGRSEALVGGPAAIGAVEACWWGPPPLKRVSQRISPGK